MTETKMSETALATTENPKEGVTPEDLIYKSSEKAVPQLHPLYEAALVERLQFDGDIPELRTGPLPDGAEPAVPVVADTMNPVLIGEMLERASAEVKGQIMEARQEQVRQIEESLGEVEPDLVQAEGGVEIAIRSVNMTPAKIEGYMPGQMPVPRKLAPMARSELKGLSTERKAELAWKFLSTTQGRRSAIDILTRRVCDLLSRKRIEILDGEVGEDPDVEAEWTIALDGPGSVQPDFPYLNVATQVFFRKTINCPRRLGRTRAFIQIRTLDNYSQREVGWRMSLKWTR